MKNKFILLCLGLLLLMGCGSTVEDESDDLWEPISESENIVEDRDNTAEKESIQEFLILETSEANIESNEEIDIAGIYTYYVDDSTLTISANEDGTYSAVLELFRLTVIEDFVGNYENSILTLCGTDSAGNPITVEVTFMGTQAKIIFTDSTWEYLPNGTEYIFDRS